MNVVGSKMHGFGLINITQFQRVAALVFGFGALLIILSVAVLGDSQVSSFTVSFYALKAILLLAPLVVVRNPGYWLHPLIFIGIWDFVLIVLPESSLIISGMVSHPGLDGVTSDVIADSLNIKLLMDCLAIIATYLGFYLARGVPALRLVHAQPSALSYKLIFVAAFSFVGIFVLANAAGGIEALVLQRGVDTDQRVFAKIGGGHWHVLAALMGPAVLIAAALMDRPLRSPIFWVVLCIALIGKFVVTGSRGGTLSILVLLFFILAARKGQIKMGRMFVFALSVLLIVGVMSDFRTQSRKMTSVSNYQYQSSIGDTTQRALGVFSKYSSQGNSDYPIYALVPESKPLLLGESYFSILVAPIPRALWAGKPMGVGRKASETFMPYKKGGVPPSAAGEAYWNFHVVGVVLVFLLWGVFLRFVWKSVAVRRMPGVMALYVVTIFYLEPHTSAVYTWLHMFVPGVLILIFYCMNPLRWFHVRPARDKQVLLPSKE